MVPPVPSHDTVEVNNPTGTLEGAEPSQAEIPVVVVHGEEKPHRYALETPADAVAV